MEKGFWKSGISEKKRDLLILGGGIVITAVLGVSAYSDSRCLGEEGLKRPEAGEGAYEQELIASVEGLGETKVVVSVEERILSKEEAEKMLKESIVLLPDLLKGNNETLSSVTEDLDFVDSVPGLPVEITWNAKSFDHFTRTGSRRDEELREPTQVILSAVLTCQEYSQDYEVEATLLPKTDTEEETLLELIRERIGQEGGVLKLPEEYQGKQITWKKPMDFSFLYFFALTASALLFLKLGSRRDRKKEKEQRAEAMEKDYAQVVSKFAMLLSAGLSIRNAWERIVLLYQKEPKKEKPVYEEMQVSFREMQKGISEIKVYEAFGDRVGEIHYKKLMALFVSEKKRGSISLLEAMNQEMLMAWEEQRRRAKQQGEKIGTKLLLPMMGMLGVVFAIILFPAFLSFQL